MCERAVVAVIKCPIMAIMELKFFHRKHLRSYEWQATNSILFKDGYSLVDEKPRTYSFAADFEGMNNSEQKKMLEYDLKYDMRPLFSSYTSRFIVHAQSGPVCAVAVIDSLAVAICFRLVFVSCLVVVVLYQV